MHLYSAYPLARVRQIVSDVLAVAAIVVFILLGRATDSAISALAALGRRVEKAGTDFSGTMSDAATKLKGIPLVGDGASAPFTRASAAAKSLADAGQEQQDVVAHLALLAGLVVALVPICFVLWIWGRRRLAFAWRAARIRKLAATDTGMELLAVRALTAGNTGAVLALGPDITARWRVGDPTAVRQLADIGARNAGVRIRSAAGTEMTS